MEYKVSELEGALLDAAVAKAESIELVEQDQGGFAAWDSDHACWRGWSACTDWRIGGPIIEREHIRIRYEYEEGWGATKFMPDGQTHDWLGPTPLIAAMRAYVASKLGEIVDLP